MSLSTAEIQNAPRDAREAYYNRLRCDYVKRYKAYDPLSAEVMYSLLQTFSLAEARLMNRLHEHAMTLSGMNVLSVLRNHGEGGCPLNTLSQLLLVTRANVTGLVDGLVRKGFVTRQAHATDRRVILARITKEGEKWLDVYMPLHCAEVRAMLSGLNQREKTQLIELLNKLRHTSCQHPREENTSTNGK